MKRITFITIIMLLLAVKTFAQNISSYDFSVVKEWINATEKLYLGFSLNRGQINKEALIYSKGPGFNVYITQRGLSFTIFSFEKENSQIPKTDNKPIKENIKVWRIDYDLIGGNIKKENITFENEISNYYENYYTQYAPDGILFVRLYKKVRIKEVYPGIDWILRYDENGNFHHEFEASPNSNIAQIKIKVKNAQIELTDEGKSVLLKTPIGIIKDGNLIAYEGKKEIRAKYTIKDNLLSFEIKDYEGKEKLLIDPHALVWGTYYGGSYSDEAYSISTDANGNVFIVGMTISTNFPTYNPGGGAYYQSNNAGYVDAFILKFNNSGVRLWATYYGGSGNDYANSISTDANGNVFVVGYTRSTNFPTQNPGGAYYQGTNAGSYDAFILKFTNNGIRLWATYYGGSDDEVANSISTDANGNVFVVGYTRSTNFPTQNPGGAYYQGTNAGSYDAFILKFTNNGIRLWATYYGGGNSDFANSISIDANGNVFVVGGTQSTDFPTLNPGGGAYYQGTCGSCSTYDDAFILKFNNSGVRLWATYYGGSNSDGAISISTDANGNVFVVGETKSTDFPTQDIGGGAYYQGTCVGCPTYPDAFISKFSGSISIPESFISSIKIKNNNVVIKLNENINGEFKVFTILGREIIRGKINNNEISFKVPSSGIYILTVNNKNVKIVVK
jgi:predicted SpoU family rRNA methylase